jgi:hypothetical protein
MFEKVVLVGNGKHWARSEEKDVLRQCYLYEPAGIVPALHWVGIVNAVVNAIVWYSFLPEVKEGFLQIAQ